MKLLHVCIFINVQKHPPENIYVFENMYVNNICMGFLNKWEHTVYSLQLAFLHLAICFSTSILLLALWISLCVYDISEASTVGQSQSCA